MRKKQLINRCYKVLRINKKVQKLCLQVLKKRLRISLQYNLKRKKEKLNNYMLRLRTWKDN